MFPVEVIGRNHQRGAALFGALIGTGEGHDYDFELFGRRVRVCHRIFSISDTANVCLLTYTDTAPVLHLLP